MKNKIVIGIDLGGTKIMTGAINASGKILQTPVITPTMGTDPAEKIIERIVESVKDTLIGLDLTTNEIEGIGIGSTGPLDIENGVILECPQLPTMNYFPLKKTISDYFKVPVIVNNDANCLIYGETVFGIARGHNNVLGFTLGTGIGSAIVLNKKIFNGSTGSAGEVWGSPYQGGMIEDYISGEGVSRIYKTISGNHLSSLDVEVLARKGDKDALKTWEEFGEHLAVAISWSINLIDPEVVILGGSISNAHELFIPSLERELRKSICPEPAAKTKIIIAELGAYAGFIGAASLFLDN